MSRSFAHLWQDVELSDVDVLLTIAGGKQQNDTDDMQHEGTQLETAPLVRLPAHRALLTISPFLRAQILRWQRKRPALFNNSSSSPRLQLSVQPIDPDKLVSVQLLQFAATVPLPDQDKAQIMLALQDASQQAAAMTCLEALYATEPLPELLARLSQEQQLQAAVLADMWEVPDVSAAVVSDLAAAADSEHKLSDAAVNHLLHMPAQPECLQPLLRQVLLSRLGDLEAVWAKEELQNMLLSLPLHVMEVLLSLDDLTVASEDTVLYTARRFIHGLPTEQRGAAKSKLATLVRCPHVSTYWLSASVLSEAAPHSVLWGLQGHVKRLLLARATDPEFQPTAAEVQDLFPKAPHSWQLQQRKHKAVDTVQLTWPVSVADIKDAARRSNNATDKKSAVVQLKSPSFTPPVGGQAWQLVMSYNRTEEVTSVGVFAIPALPSDDMFYKSCFMLSFTGGLGDTEAGWTPVLKASTSWGYSDAFEIGPMADGWDDVKWAAKGLPASGEIEVKLTVTAVKHCKGS